MKNPWDNFTNKTQTTTNPWDSFSQGKVGSSNLSEKEALKYALEMGFTDSFRGIQQMYGNITGSDDLLEKLKEKDTLLKEIFENEDYGAKAFGFYLASSIADPVGLIPFLGWGKKIDGIGKATAFGVGAGAYQSGVMYQSEGMDRGQSALTGATLGGILGLGSAGLIQAIGKAKGSSAGKFARTTKQRQGDILQEQADLLKAGKPLKDSDDARELAEKTIKNLEANPPKNINNNIEKFWSENVGDPVWNFVGQNWGSALAGTFGAISGYNAWNDPESTEAQKMFAAFLLGASGVGVTKLGGKLKVNADGMELKEVMGRGLVDNYGLPKNYLDLKRQTFGEVNALSTKFAEVAQIINRLKPEERKIVNSLITGDIDSIANKEYVGFSNEARKIIKRAGQEMVDAGLLSPSVYQKNVDTYLHRSYTKHLNKEVPVEAVKGARYLKIIGNELKGRGTPPKTLTKKFFDKNKDKDYKGFEVIEEFIDEKTRKPMVRIRRDFTKEERKAFGEIEDAAFNVAETGRLMTNDLSVYKLYEKISKDSAFALDEIAFKTRLDAGKLQADDWVQMPDSIVRGLEFGKNPIKTYGKLSGKFVTRPIFNDLKKINDLKEKSGLDVFEGYDTLNRFWKKSKTAWNPTVHVNNTISNVLLYDFAGGSYKYIPRGYSELLKGLDGDTSAGYYKLAKEYGVFDVDLVSRELSGEVRDALKIAVKELADEGSLELRNATGYADSIYKRLLKKGYDMSAGNLEKLYQLEDQVFRMALFMDRAENGLGVTKAAADAKKWFIDYNINAPFINAMRRVPTPFLSYTYRVVPLLAESAVYRPWKFGKWAAIGYGINEVGKGKVPFAELVSEDPDYGRFRKEVGNEEAERILMRKNLQEKFFGLPFMPDTTIKTPFSSKLLQERKGEEVPLYIDVKRFIPGGDIFSVSDKGIGIPLDFLGFKGKEIGLPAPLNPNFGAAGEIMIPLITQTDPFTRQKIQGLGLGNDSAVIAQHILSRLLPNIPATAFTVPLFGPEAAKYTPFSNSFGSKKITKAFRQAIEGGESLYATDFSPAEAIMSTFGFKLQPIEISKLIGTNSREFQRQYTEVRRGVYAIQRQYVENTISFEEAQKQINNLYDTFERLINRYTLKQTRASEAVRENKKTGGRVSDVEEEPADRKNPITGESYSETAEFDFISETGDEDEQMKRLGFVIGGLSKALKSTVTKGIKSKGAKRLREEYTRPKFLENLKQKPKKDSEFNVSAKEVHDLLLDGQITIKEAQNLLKDYGYQSETIKKILRSFKDVEYNLGDDFITFREKFNTGANVDVNKYDSKNVIDDLSKQFMNPKEQRNFEADAAESLNKLVNEQRLPEEYKLNITGDKNNVRYVEGSNDPFNDLKHYNLGIKYGDSVIGTTLINAREVGQILTQGRFLDSAKDIQNNIKGIKFLRDAKGNKEEALMLALSDIEKKYNINK